MGIFPSMNRLLLTIPLLTLLSSGVWAEENKLTIEPQKVQKLMQRSKLLESQIQVRYKNAQQRNDPSSKQYNIGYSDGYNKAVLDLLKSQLLTGVTKADSSTVLNHNPSAAPAMSAVGVSSMPVASQTSATAAVPSSDADGVTTLSVMSPVLVPMAVVVPAAAAKSSGPPATIVTTVPTPKAAPDAAPKKNFSELLSLSTQSLATKNWSQAVSYASAALSINSDSGTALINRSWAYAEQGLLHKALLDANESVRLLPNNALAYNNRAYTYELLEDISRARQDYSKACQLRFNNACGIVAKIDQLTANRPKKIADLMKQSQIEIRQKNWRALEDLSNQVIFLDSNYTEALINRSWAYAEQGQLDKALTDASRAILLSPSNALAYNNRAYTYELRDQLDEATADYKKACELNYQVACDVVKKIKQLTVNTKSNQIGKMINRSLEMYRKGNWHAVEQISNKILILDPNNALAYVNRAGARTEMGLIYNALDDIDNAIRLNPKLGIAYNNKAYALERMGKIASAAIEYKNACELGVQQSCQDYQRINLQTTSRIR